ncbi:DNA-directed RNA polymerase III subunit RPC9 [Ischnura elegans]|uniref:DNA-directed RNA polymerase III subunit RPC9 n=1 Tax=Ischnura elegans TaxID=197161 RepID=UPI001ED8A797|nr:DNA-directed RNA polymerase III subunit RPC9 [Ischnura elegans]
METVEENAAILCNYEVLTLLEELRKQPKLGNRKNQLATIAYETTKYLKGTPCCSQTPESIQNFLSALAPFNLTKAEKLMLVNLRPMTPVEIQLIVEESEERMSDAQVEELLEVIAAHLPPDPNAPIKSEVEEAETMDDPDT